MKRKKSVLWAMAFLFFGALIFNNQRSYGASDICVQSPYIVNVRLFGGNV